jgi:surfactin synthase thioesterase subunit
MMPAVKNPWLLRTPGNRPFRLYCFCYAGGNAHSFLEWQPAMPPHVEICAVQLPGRGARFHETPLTDFDALIGTLSQVIGAEPAMPFAFFGHSLGGLVAFELARRQQRLGLRQPQQLIVSGCEAPQFRSPPERLHLLDDEALTARLRVLNGTPRDILEHRELMQVLLPTIRADMALVDDFSYRSGPLLDIPLTVFAGRDDDIDHGDQVLGWGKETTGKFEAHWFDGDHFFINGSREAVWECLGQVLAVSPSSSKPGAEHNSGAGASFAGSR